MTVNRIVFATDDLPAKLGDRARFALWHDLCADLFCRFEFERPNDRPFEAKLEYVPLGVVGVGLFGGTVSRVARTRRDIATDGSDAFCFGINLGSSPIQVSQAGTDFVIEPAKFGLLFHELASVTRAGHSNEWVTFNVPRKHLLELVANAEDLVTAPPGPPSEALRHLRRYAEFLFGDGETHDDPSLADCIGGTLLDLIALSLGACKDARELSELRGLRAARLNAVVSAIKAGFSDPAFSVRDVASRLGIAPHTVQNLLSETGSSFSDRVLELRLQKARAMLSSSGNGKMKVSEIAFACGFSEASYFNRCFRRRFGASPTQYREGNGKQI